MNRRLLVSIAPLLVLLAAAARAQTVNDVYPVDPPDGGTAGIRPMLQVGAQGTDLAKMRFRIEMSRDDFETIAYAFDQKEEPAGWTFTALAGENGAVYRVRTPLQDGSYTWRAAAWNGVDWVHGRKISRLRIDGVPPADVAVRMRVDPRRKSVLLEWDAVTVDRDGRPEVVNRYKVYRYERRAPFFVVRPFEIGTTDGLSFEDGSPQALGTGLLFYKVTAEDAAGNEPERRY